MTTSLVSSPHTIALAGIDATDTFLNLPPTITQQDERFLISHIRTVGRGLPWWVGDFALHFQSRIDRQRKDEEAAAKAEARQPKEIADYADTLAQAWGMSASYIRNAATVSSFYPVSNRLEKLTWRHHQDAMMAAGGVKHGTRESAKGWLKKAEAGGWSCADLRQKALPATLNTRPPSDPEDNPFDPLDTADKWATQHHAELKAITRERAQNLIIRFRALIEFVDHLRALTGMTADDVRGVNKRFDKR
jgi:hypothetical protein